jgi:F-type H+-transporting ATPase subunit epsilon
MKNAKTDVDLARARSELTILAAELSALRRYRAHK